MTRLALPSLAALGACGLTGLYAWVLTAFGRLEHPGQRSMHAKPVPTGAGIVVVFVIVLAWIVFGSARDHFHTMLLAVFAALSAVSWFDDQYRLPVGLRLAAHTLAVALLLGSLAPDLRLAPTLPLVLERTLLGVAWIWFINLFNFMDGIDGLAGAEVVAIAAGYAAVITAARLGPSLLELSLLAAAACAGYLVWNWHPARVFMGDAGSIPFGFLTGWLMIDLAARGHWAAAIILPAYFATDATLTLTRRITTGKKPWQPHRSHFYQRAVLGRASPPVVVLHVVVANAVLLVFALVSIRFPIPALIAAAAVVGALLLDLSRLAKS